MASFFSKTLNASCNRVPLYKLLRTCPIVNNNCDLYFSEISRRIMGVLLSCCRGSSSESELLTPSVETKRRQVAEAAERRLKEQESRGIKDPEKLKQKLQKLEELEKKQAKAYDPEAPKLTWTVG